MAANTVETMVPMILIRFTLMPEAWANRGLEPTALIAIPVLDRMNSHTRAHMRKKNSSSPVGKIYSDVPRRIVMASVLFITPA